MKILFGLLIVGLLSGCKTTAMVSFECNEGVLLYNISDIIFASSESGIARYKDGSPVKCK